MNQNLFGKLLNLIFLTIPSVKSKIALTEKCEIILKGVKLLKHLVLILHCLQNLLTFFTGFAYQVILLIKYKVLMVVF